MSHSGNVAVHYFGQPLPPVVVSDVTRQLAFGLVVRHAMKACLSLVLSSIYSQRCAKKRPDWTASLRQELWWIAELGASLAYCPTAYLAAMSSQRMVLATWAPRLSDALAVVDCFEFSKCLSVSLFSFVHSSGSHNSFVANEDYLSWQVPSLLVKVGWLLLLRRVSRIRLHRRSCGREVLALVAQVLIRAFLAEHCVEPPATLGELINFVGASAVEWWLQARWCDYATVL